MRQGIKRRRTSTCNVWTDPYSKHLDVILAWLLLICVPQAVTRRGTSRPKSHFIAPFNAIYGKIRL